MPFWDRDYGDRQFAGGDQSGWRMPGRMRGGGIQGWRAGRMTHDQHRVTGSGGKQGGERGRSGGSNQGRGSSRGGRR